MLDIYAAAELLYGLLGRKARVIGSTINENYSGGFARRITIDQIVIARLEGYDRIAFFEGTSRYIVNTRHIDNNHSLIFEGHGDINQEPYPEQSFNRLTVEVL